MAERPFWRVNSKVQLRCHLVFFSHGNTRHSVTHSVWCFCVQWEVPPDYISVILGIKDNLTRDLVYILMAKGLHCSSIKVCRWFRKCIRNTETYKVRIFSQENCCESLGYLFLSSQDFVHARQLFSACLELVTEFSPKLRQVMLNEILLLEVRAHESLAAEGSKDRPPPDLVSRVRGYLEMRIHGMLLALNSVNTIQFMRHIRWLALKSHCKKSVQNIDSFG